MNEWWLLRLHLMPSSGGEHKFAYTFSENRQKIERVITNYRRMPHPTCLGYIVVQHMAPNWEVQWNCFGVLFYCFIWELGFMP